MGVRAALGWIRDRRVKRTSFGVRMREEVRVKMLGGEKWGRVERRNRTVLMNRMFRDGMIVDGVGRMGTGEVRDLVRTVRK